MATRINPAMMGLQSAGAPQPDQMGMDPSIMGGDPLSAGQGPGNPAADIIQGMLDGTIPFSTTSLEQVLQLLQGSPEGPEAGGLY